MKSTFYQSGKIGRSENEKKMKKKKISRQRGVKSEVFASIPDTKQELNHLMGKTVTHQL